MIMIALLGVLVFLTAASMWIAVVYLTPVTNRILGLIWEDPTERRRKKILKRLRELHVDGNIPEETAVLMAAKEYNASEQAILDVVGAVDARDVAKLVTGRMSPLGFLLHGFDRALRKGSGRRRG
jgi:hypothetical protein